MTPFPIKVVIVLRTGAVEQHHLMLDGQARGTLIRSPDAPELTGARVFTFRDDAPFKTGFSAVNKGTLSFYPYV